MKTSLSYSLILLAGLLSARGLTAAEGETAKPKLETLGNSTSSANTDAEQAIEIRAGTDSSKATLKWESEISDGSEQHWTVSASAPLDKGSDFTRIAAFDGFANSFSLSAGLTSLWPENPYLSLAGFNVSAGHKDFKYTDPTSLKQAKASRTPFSGGVFYGSRFATKGAFFTIFGAEYKEEYKDQDSKGVVLPPDTSGREFVVTGPYGRPKRNPQMLLSIDYRTQILRDKKPTVRTGLKISYDLKSDHYGAEIPVVFLHGEKDAKWTGGLLFGYQSEDHRFYGAIVVGAPFKIISPP